MGACQSSKNRPSKGNKGSNPNDKPMVEWSVGEVYDWASSVVEGEIRPSASILKKNGIDGRKLVNMTDQDFKILIKDAYVRTRLKLLRDAQLQLKYNQNKLNNGVDFKKQNKPNDNNNDNNDYKTDDIGTDMNKNQILSGIDHGKNAGVERGGVVKLKDGVGGGFGGEVQLIKNNNQSKRPPPNDNNNNNRKQEYEAVPTVDAVDEALPYQLDEAVVSDMESIAEESAKELLGKSIDSLVCIIHICVHDITYLLTKKST